VPAKVYVQWEEGQRAPQCSPTGQTSPLRSGVAAVRSPANRVQEAACLVVAQRAGRDAEFAGEVAGPIVLCVRFSRLNALISKAR
jgi:hypothetical protein